MKQPIPWILNYLKKHNLTPTLAHINFAQRVLAKKRKGAKGPGGFEITTQDSNAEWQIIYGTVKVGGVFSLVHVNSNNQNLHLIITLTGSELNNITSVWFDDDEIVWNGSAGWVTSGKYAQYGNRVYLAKNSGTLNQSAIAAAVSNAGEVWTANHRQRGCGHIYIKLVWDNLLFADGMPEFMFTVQGKPVLDTRTNTTGFSANAALILADYLTDTRFGLGIPIADIDTTALNAAADICDQNINLLQGGTEKRYTINGAFHTDETPESVIQKMLSAMAGYLVYSNGKWKILAGAYRTPSIYLNEDDLRGGLKIQARGSRRDIFNGVRGTYLSPENKWEISDFPAYKNNYYKTQDSGIEALEDIELPFSISGSTCQRLAKLALEIARQEVNLEAEFSLKGYQLEPGDTVYLSNTRMGWTNKIFEVQKIALFCQTEGDTPVLTTSLNLKETASTVFDWASGEQTQTDLAPNTSLPDAYSVLPLSGLVLTSGTTELYIRADGTIFTRIRASWNAASDFFVSSGGKIEIQFKQSTASDWIEAPSVSPSTTFTYILDVADGVQYDLRIRAVSALNTVSSWTTIFNHLVIGKTAPPSNVTGFGANIDEYGINLFWAPVSDLDLSNYEIRLGTSTDTWATSSLIGQTKTTLYRYPIKTAGAYTFRIKAIDSSKNYSTLEDFTAVNIAVPTSTNPTFAISGPELTLNWAASVGQFAIFEYKIYEGLTFSGASYVGAVKALRFTQNINWGGLKRFWVVPIDIAGNAGTENSVDVVIASPGTVQSSTSQVIDNNILLKWNAPTSGTLPIAYYRVSQGPTFSGASLIGTALTTFLGRFEMVAGNYTYWIQGVDTAGNIGAEIGIAVSVASPPDFTLQANQAIDVVTMTLSNAFVEIDSIVMPADTSETYANHFTTNGWTTWDDAINAGATIYLNKVPATASAEKTIDFGSTIMSTIIKLSYLQTDVVGATTTETRIGYSSDNITYTYVTNQPDVFATNFRYVKIRISEGI